MISLKNVSKTYDGEGDSYTIALRNVSLEIKDGDLLAIMGASGSGKSTLLNIIGCLDTFDRGVYMINGRRIDTLSVKEIANLRNRTFGYVLQDYALVEEWTVYDNICLPLEYAGISRKEFPGKADKVLSQLGIFEKKYVTAKRLSGGQRQRAAIARAIINKPDIILADEPTGALDKKTGKEIIDILTTLNKAGHTVIIVTHDSSIACTCDRIITLSDGEIIEDEQR